MRKPLTIEDLSTARDQLTRSSRDLTIVIEKMEKSGAELLLHGARWIGKGLVELEAWTTSLVADAEEQVRADAGGFTSHAARNKERSNKYLAKLRDKKKKTQDEATAAAAEKPKATGGKK